jgi:hypothetical protein
MNIKKIEELVFDDMKIYHQNIIDSAKLFNIDEKILASVIYVEKIQYELPNILSKLKQYKIGLCEKRLFNIILYKWLKRTAGYTHILAENVFFTIEKFKEMNSQYSDYLKMEYTELLSYNVDIAIKVSAGILRCIQEFWSTEIDLSHNPEILGTLYNINYRYISPKPHKNPVSGGSDMDLIIDGVHYRDKIDFKHLNFGTRTKLVYESVSMNNFFRGDNEAITSINSAIKSAEKFINCSIK